MSRPDGLRSCEHSKAFHWLLKAQRRRCTVHIPPWYKPYTGGMRVVFLRCGGNSVRVPRAYGHQSIYGQTRIPFLFQEHTLTRASMPKPYSLRVPRAYNQRIHAQTIRPFVLQEHMVTRASMAKPLLPSCSKSIRSPVHPCIHAQIIISFVFQEHSLTSASMLKSYILSCSKSTREPVHLCPSHNSSRVPKAYANQSIHAQTIRPFVFQEHTAARASMPKPSFFLWSKSVR